MVNVKFDGRHLYDLTQTKARCLLVEQRYSVKAKGGLET